MGTLTLYNRVIFVSCDEITLFMVRLVYVMHCRLAKIDQDHFSFHSSVVKPKPITKSTDNPVNQSKLEVITGSWREARENVCERVTIGFGCFDWMKKWRVFF